ncbi:antitoxin HicB [Variibacter gotjawalensis]|uniref:Antitoxin HicB n=1 Tax=Variibacter gotjawalensis TaxID=1333996 RepID=A0A0S3PRV4_9BRAD|nr:type II toxin-antitoxin system HicB family antitoxin [Variibacter gotjawalensis]NIK48981.1 antitoxin HicB [Variibacter gotjawalensis]RZS50837.1 antitoxin HicB [Variibacter gotjawalensis]BAT58671.1 antitoxin HicB [Variibacter gotjawalensis]
MQDFSYGAIFEKGEDHGIVVSFPDVPEAISQGDDVADAETMAADALALALLSYLDRGLALPTARKAATAQGKKLRYVSVEPTTAAKLAVLSAFADAKISKSALARRIGKDEKEVRRILDPWHATKLAPLTVTLRALGKRLVVGVTDAAA